MLALTLHLSKDRWLEVEVETPSPKMARTVEDLVCIQGSKKRQSDCRQNAPLSRSGWQKALALSAMLNVTLVLS